MRSSKKRRKRQGRPQGTEEGGDSGVWVGGEVGLPLAAAAEAGQHHWLVARGPVSEKFRVLKTRPRTTVHVISYGADRGHADLMV